jgi:phage terminase Nu1 subunit (DNA packaging protein)
MNYFNYFTEIEDTFIRRRGKHLLLSPIDWALIETWKERGVPLHVALNGIERAFDSYYSKPRHRTVKTLLYCQEEVEAQYAEWVESQIGATNDNVDGSPEPSIELPFPRNEILNHLDSVREELIEIHRRRAKEDALGEALLRVATRLQELKEDFASAIKPNAEKLETSLTQLEDVLHQALIASLSSVEIDTAHSEVASQLHSYKNRMDQSTYELTLSNMLSKTLRERHSIPRLSLFYI